MEGIRSKGRGKQCPWHNGRTVYSSCGDVCFYKDKEFDGKVITRCDGELRGSFGIYKCLASLKTFTERDIEQALISEVHIEIEKNETPYLTT